MLRVEPVIESLNLYLKQTDPGGVLAVCLFGSSPAGGLRPHSATLNVRVSRVPILQATSGSWSIAAGTRMASGDWLWMTSAATTRSEASLCLSPAAAHATEGRG